MSKAYLTESISDPTETERETLREMVDSIVISQSNYTNSGKLHVPDPDADAAPACGLYTGHSPETEWIRKPLDVYPPGYFGWCAYCTALLREGKLPGEDL